MELATLGPAFSRTKGKEGGEHLQNKDQWADQHPHHPRATLAEIERLERTRGTNKI